MNAKHRRMALAAAAVATLMAVAWTAAQEEGAEPAPAPAATRAVESASAAPATSRAEFPDIAALETQRRPFEKPAADPFAPRSWKPRVAEKPPAPVAPPLPYSYFGRMVEDGKLHVFLQRGERTYMVRGGDVLDRDYRIDDITPNAVVITYLPLKERQVLNTGSE